MNETVRFGGYSMLPPAVKNLLIINVLFYIATYVFGRFYDIDLYSLFRLRFISAPDFKIWQPITYMFMHGNLSHIFFNMFALWMFGGVIENRWGTGRFLIYYFVTGVGAAIVHYLVIYFQIAPDLNLLNQFLSNPTIEHYDILANEVHSSRLKDAILRNYIVYRQNGMSLTDLWSATSSIKGSFLNQFNVVGASGAVFGLLLAFGMLFPNAQIYIYFLFPIKAKWFVILYGLLELWLGVSGTSDGVAHFAHLGGMIFGFFLILYWRKKRVYY